jgi:hypothetical protein
MGKLLAIIAFCFVTPVFGQTFRNIRVHKKEDKVIIVYDLVNEEAGSKVIVKIFASHDNFGAPLTGVTGDVGEVLPGPNRRIEWSPDKVQNAETLTFQFKGDVIHGWNFTKPGNGKLRRGKKYQLRWVGGLPQDTVTLKFITPAQEEINITQSMNTGFYTWRVPKKLATGAGYVLRLSKGREVREEQIIMKRKIPTFIYAIPLMGAAIFLKGSSGDTSKPGELPDAPKPD